LSFETGQRDVLGRIGVFETKSGKLETPALFPVVNPLAQEIPPRVMFEKLGSKALITNAYLIRRQAGDTGVHDIHDFLDFPGIVATDSGAYQMLRYGEVEVGSAEIIDYQQSIRTDIGVILDVPTGSRASRTRAMETVNETIRRADEARKVIKNRDIAWVGPIQGGLYPDLVAHSAREMAKRGFDIYALGSPTEVMEQYLFADLVDMILAAKMNLPFSTPLHLFGAGHPFMFSLAVALGCDLFDSAAYILYARRGRYLTQAGTLHLGQMEYFPCKCNTCASTSPDKVRSLPVAERTRLLAEHNLLACFQEIETIKESIVEGRLWELVEIRCRSHPRLLEAFQRTQKHRAEVACCAPSTKRKGILFFDSTSLQRPEYVMHLERLLGDYVPPREARVLVLAPVMTHRPGDESSDILVGMTKAGKGAHVCLYSPPYGLVPSELQDTFPFSQTETLEEPDPEILKVMAKAVQSYLAKNRTYRAVVLVRSDRGWHVRYAGMCKSVCTKLRVRFSSVTDKEISSGLTGTAAKGKRYLGKNTKGKPVKRRE